jgi:MarR family transcriptional regulator for hemolysin
MGRHRCPPGERRDPLAAAALTSAKTKRQDSPNINDMETGNMIPAVKIESVPELETYLINLMTGIHEKSRRWADRKLREFGLTYPRYLAILILSKQQGVTQRELARKLDTDTTTMTVICDALEKKKMLIRQSDPSDRRVNRLFLTDKGTDAFAKAHPRIQEGHGRIFADLPRGKAEEAVELLFGLLKRADSLLESAE